MVHEHGVPHARASLPAASPEERRARADLIALLGDTPIPPDELWRNLPLYLGSPSVFDIIAMRDLYQRVLSVPGVVVEFGVRWGQRLSTFMALREILEPRNPYRTIIGFDTFSGFPDVSAEDGNAPKVRPGEFTVTPGYQTHLTDVLAAHEHASTLGHLRRFDIRAGDVRETVPAYLAEHPETVIALAYFDLDLYAPTKASLIFCVILSNSGDPGGVWPCGDRPERPQGEDGGGGHITVETPPGVWPRPAGTGQRIACRT